MMVIMFCFFSILRTRLELLLLRLTICSLQQLRLELSRCKLCKCIFVASARLYFFFFLTKIDSNLIRLDINVLKHFKVWFVNKKRNLSQALVCLSPSPCLCLAGSNEPDYFMLSTRFARGCKHTEIEISIRPRHTYTQIWCWQISLHFMMSAWLPTTTPHFLSSLICTSLVSSESTSKAWHWQRDAVSVRVCLSVLTLLTRVSSCWCCGFSFPIGLIEIERKYCKFIELAKNALVLQLPLFSPNLVT